MQVDVRGQVLLLALAMAAAGPRTSTAQQSSTTCICDLNSDGLVGTNDLLWMLALFGSPVSDEMGSSFSAADTNGDGIVSTPDLLMLLAEFGRSCQVDAPPPSPPIVTFEQAASQFEAALADAAADPSTPIVGVASEVALEGDVVQLEMGTARRLEFEVAFSVAIARLLGNGTVRPGIHRMHSLLAN